MLSPRTPAHEVQNGINNSSSHRRSKNTESNTLGRLSKSTSRLVNNTTNHDNRDINNYYAATQTLPLKSNNNNNNHHHRRPPPPPPPPSQSSSRHYNSMINISIKNSITSPSPNSLNLKKSEINIKPEKDDYKLLRSKSFNVEANGGEEKKIPYKSNTQLNRLDETPPLKSPGILASISQSNRDLFKHDYYY